MKKDNISAKVDNLLDDLITFNQDPARDPVAFSAAAIKAQSVQAILTGLQVQATIRVAEATERAAKALETLASNFDEAATTSKVLQEGLSDIRKAITSNS